MSPVPVWKDLDPMAMQPIDGVSFRVMAFGAPVPGACILLKLKMGLKNDVSMIVGPADEGGRIIVSLDELRERASETASDFPMDYRPDTWTHEVESRAMTRTDIERFEEGYEKWWKHAPEIYKHGEVETVRGWADRIRVYAEESIDLTGEVLGTVIERLVVRPATWIEDNRHRLWPKRT